MLLKVIKIKNMKFTILLNGNLTVTDRLKHQIKDSYIIAADNGIQHIEKLEIIPQLWVGDFDSCDNINDYLQRYSIPVKKYSRDKDKTDGALAIEEALQRGASELIIVGAFGGDRFDHIFSHMSQSIKLSLQNKKVLLTSGDSEAEPILPNFLQEFDYKAGTLFSILPFTSIKNLTIEGAKWCLSNEDIEFGISLTLSNEVENCLKVSLTSGQALLWAKIM